MFYTTLFLLLSVGAELNALSNKQRLDFLEANLNTFLDKSEGEFLKLEKKIQKINTCNLRLCNETKENVSSEEEELINELNLQLDTINKTITEEISNVYAYIEKNSHALMDEFQNTLTVLMNQHRNMNQKIRFNSNSVKRLQGSYRKFPSVKNDQIKTFEHKISVLDDDLEKLLKSVTRQSESINDIGQHLLKLDRKDDDFFEHIERNYRGVSGLDHNLIEIEQRFQEFALDFDKIKEEIKMEITEIKTKLPPDQVNKETIENECPQLWVQHNSKCYKYTNVAVDWKTALIMCQNLNARLAEPEIKEEMNYIRRSFPGWIGASDQGTNGTFLWETSKNVVEQLRSEMRDDGNSSPKCVYIVRTMIQVESCAMKFHYICEKDVQ